MRKTYILSLICISFLQISFSKYSLPHKIYVPDYIYASGQKLILNGAGMRNKYYMDLYLCALYLVNKSKDAKSIMEADETMSIRLHIVSNWVTNTRMQLAIREGFNKSTNNNTKHIQQEIEMMTNAFSEKIVKDDVFETHYIPGKGCMVFKNAKHLCTIHGIEFKKALFGIWLSPNNPNHNELRKQLTGE